MNIAKEFLPGLDLEGPAKAICVGVFALVVIGLVFLVVFKKPRD